ncbi:MAG: AAA family ATPase [Ignavibacteria bacterium]
MATTIDWHFARSELATSYLEKTFGAGISRLAFFGRRRIGKTEFMRLDLMPAAQARGIPALYCSMWENKDRPYLGLIRALREQVEPVREVKHKLAIQTSLWEQAEIGVELERASKPVAASTGELQELTALFQELLKQSKREGLPCLLVIDEIQHLATSAKFATFAATLRTMLDMAGEQVRVVFTGSSYADLQRLFRDNKAPFYDFASVVVFEPMSHDFVHHLEDIYRRIVRQVLPAGRLGEIFEEVGRNAHITRALVERLILRLSRDIDAEWEAYKSELHGPEGWCEKQWEGLHESDRIVYRLVMEGQELFSEASLALYAKAGFSRGSAQQALARLQNRGLISRVAHGRYVTDIPLLDSWIKGDDLV